MTIVDTLEAKTDSSRLVEAVENGTVSEIVISRNGKRAARLVPIASADTSRRLGMLNSPHVARRIQRARRVGRQTVPWRRQLKLLLDTHVSIWALALPKRLTDAGRALIIDLDNEIVVSTVSIFGIAL